MINRTKLRLIVNTIPLVNVNTGIGRYLKCLYSELERRYSNQLEIGYFNGHSVTPSLPNGPANYVRWAKQVDLFWKIPPHMATFIRTIFQGYRELRFRLIAKHYDLYHEAAFFPFIPPSHLKTIFTLHDFSLFRFPQYHPKERVLFAQLFFKRRCRLVERFISVSEFTRKEAQRFLGINGSRISVIPLANNPKIFYPRPPEEVAALKRRFKLPDDYFVFVGTGDPRKNRPTISKAIQHAGLNVPLVVAGWTGWSGVEAKEKNVITLGYVDDDDLARLYSGACALVYPSLYEGFGLPVLEAMSCGCPVICSNRAGLPEAAGDAALYVSNPMDANELGNLLKTLHSDRDMRQQLITNGLNWSTRFSWEKTAARTLENFLSLI